MQLLFLVPFAVILLGLGVLIAIVLFGSHSDPKPGGTTPTSAVNSPAATPGAPVTTPGSPAVAPTTEVRACYPFQPNC